MKAIFYDYDMGGGIRYDSDEYIENIHQDGGPGSGNWGHGGRPGKVGGSASGGGKAYRIGTKKSGFTSEAKRRREKKLTKTKAGGEVQNGSPSNRTLSDSEKRKVKEVKREMGCSEEKAIKYHDAIAMLTDPFEAAERGVNISDKDVKKNLTDFIDNSPEWDGKLLYRGANLTKGEFEKLQERFENEEPVRASGKIFDSYGVTSWTKKENVADKYLSGSGQKVKFALQGAENAADISKYSLLKGEEEVITKNSQEYEIAFITTDSKGTPLIVLEEI